MFASLGIREYIIIGLGAVVLSMSGWVYYVTGERNSALKDLGTMQAKFTQVSQELYDEKNSSYILASDLKAARSKLDLMTEENRINMAALQERIVKVAELSKRVEIRTAKLPAVIQPNKVTAETDEERENSLKRIKLVWESYCTEHGDLSLCTNYLASKDN